MNTTDFLLLRALHFRHPGARSGVDGVDWSMPAGAFHCLLGRSGCGKSTLLKLAAGLLLPDQGQVVLEGRPLTGPDARIGFVFQSPTLLDWLSALDNVLLPASLKGRPGPDTIAHARELLQQLDLGGLEQRRPGQLSGGQQSRVAIARALLTRPRLLLMDEPFAALDALTREELQDSVLAFCRRYGISVLFVTHDIAEAVYLGDRVAVMDAGRLSHVSDIPPLDDDPTLRRQDAGFIAQCARLRAQMEHKSC